MILAVDYVWMRAKGALYLLYIIAWQVYNWNCSQTYPLPHLLIFYYTIYTSNLQ